MTATDLTNDDPKQTFVRSLTLNQRAEVLRSQPGRPRTDGQRIDNDLARRLLVAVKQHTP